jgi:putative tryptophan/tyrosine transport system substrate-binding protein
MRRRDFILLVGGVAIAWSSEGRAQQSGKIYRVGLLTNGVVVGATDEMRKNLVSSLAAQGFVEGRNLIFEQRSADAQRGRIAGLVNELNAANIDVIVTFGYRPPWRPRIRPGPFLSLLQVRAIRSRPVWSMG